MTIRCARHPHALLAACGLAALAPAHLALAQCDFTVPNVPDFDQRRTASGNIPGLPGSGNMYCAPTAMVNWFAYFANRGAPQPAILDGPRNWQSSNNYNRATTALSTMGALMDTDPVDGTGGTGWKNGTIIWALAYTGNRFNVSHNWCGGTGGCPTPSKFFTTAKILGGYISVAYGYYNDDGNNRFTRTGGHVVTLRGMRDSNCTGIAELRVSDPWTEDSTTVQQTFQIHIFDVQRTEAFFRGSSGGSYTQRVQYRALFGNTPKFLDSWQVLFPTFALTSGGTQDVESIRIVRGFVLDGTNFPTVQDFPKPANTGPIVDMAQHPEALTHYYITDGPPGPVPQPSQLWKFDLFTQQSTPAVSGPDLRNIVFNRFGQFYLQDGSTIKLFDPQPDPPAELATQNFSTRPDALAYDDRLDNLVVLSEQPAAGGPRSLVRRPRGLTGIGTTFLLPAAVSIPGDGSIAPDPTADGVYWVTSDLASFIYKLGISAGNLVVLDSFRIPGGVNPTSLNVDDNGHVFFTGNGLVNHYYKPAGGIWQPFPNSLWAGKPGGNRFALSRSRTNHEPALHEGPGFVNILNPEQTPGIAECYANCDQSTTTPTLTPADFVCYLNLFRAGLWDANCDGSTGTPFLSPADFVCFLNTFRAGCN